MTAGIQFVGVQFVNEWHAGSPPRHKGSAYEVIAPPRPEIVNVTWDEDRERWWEVGVDAPQEPIAPTYWRRVIGRP